MAPSKEKPKSEKIEKFIIRLSAAEYLTFVAASGQGGVETVFADNELGESTVIRKFRMALIPSISTDLKSSNLMTLNCVKFDVI